MVVGEVGGGIRWQFGEEVSPHFNWRGGSKTTVWRGGKKAAFEGVKTSVGRGGA